MSSQDAVKFPESTADALPTPRDRLGQCVECPSHATVQDWLSHQRHSLVDKRLAYKWWNACSIHILKQPVARDRDQSGVCWRAKTVAWQLESGSHRLSNEFEELRCSMLLLSLHCKTFVQPIFGLDNKVSLPFCFLSDVKMKNHKIIKWHAFPMISKTFTVLREVWRRAA